MKIRAICKRCHRLRVVLETGYCGDCNGFLREQERPRRGQRLSEISPNEIQVSPNATPPVLTGAGPTIVYTTAPVAPASALRASDVPRGVDLDDLASGAADPCGGGGGVGSAATSDARFTVGASGCGGASAAPTPGVVRAGAGGSVYHDDSAPGQDQTVVSKGLERPDN